MIQDFPLTPDLPSKVTTADFVRVQFCKDCRHCNPRPRPVLDLMRAPHTSADYRNAICAANPPRLDVYSGERQPLPTCGLVRLGDPTCKFYFSKEEK